MASNRCSRVQQADQSRELGKSSIKERSEPKRTIRRNALADISTVATQANETCQKHQYHQLAERVRELQKEVVPDLLLYPITSPYSPFSSITPNSTGHYGNMPTYAHQQSTSGSTTSSVPTQRFGLSSKILGRAHDIPERFWIDWQQKQMQERIDELEYIKNNLGCSPSSSLLLNEMEDNRTDTSAINPRLFDNEVRRKSVLYLQEAQRLANERRTSLARTASFNESRPENFIETSSVYDNVSDNDDDNESSFNFDQRSDDTIETANLSDFDEIPSRPITPTGIIQQFQSIQEPSRLTISLPFTYINTQEQIIFPPNYRQISTQPTLEKIVEVNDDDDAIQINSPTPSIEDVAQINTEYNVTLLKRADLQKINPLFYTKATVNRSIEFHKYRPIASLTYMNSSDRDITTPIPIYKQKTIQTERSLSPTLSFISARSRLSSITDIEDLDNDDDDVDDIRSVSVISPSVSIASHSHSFSPVTLTNTYHSTRKNALNSSSLEYVSSDVEECLTINDNTCEQTDRSFTSSCYSMTSSDEDDHSSFSRTLFTCRHHHHHHQQRQKRKEKGNSSCLSLISTPSSQNNFTCLCNSFCQTKENKESNNNDDKRTLKTTYNTSIISSKRTRQWKQNNDNFRRDVLVNDNNEHVIRSSSSSSSSSTAAEAAAAGTAVAVVADSLLQRQRRKQTRLKRKAESMKRKEKRKKGKKERNKKSPLSTSKAEAAEASLFQFPTLDRPRIDTSVIFYPHEQLRCAERSGAKEKICFPIQTTAAEHQKQESKLNSVMADGQTNHQSNSIPKRKDNVRVFVHRRRRLRQQTTKHRKRVFLHSSSSSSNNSHETLPSTSNNLEELVTLIENQINNKKDKSRKNKNIIVVNYKPVFINSRQQKLSETANASSTSISKPMIIPTDDDFSSATHYSRRRSLTTTSSDGSPRRSTTSRSHNQQSVSLDLPDVEDPLMFIEMMYQQLFTEDGRLRSGTEPTALAHCVKQIVRNSRRNSMSSSIAHGSTSSLSKHLNVNTNHQRQVSSSSYLHHLIPSSSSSSPSPQLMPNERYNSASEENDDDENEEEDEEEEEEEEPNTLVLVNNQRPT
ncbi:hypothetical protein I4U23_018408 [Adineta vaga]|nr:hypothetical protein I4U23_018408 [Adineta vaga]